MAKTIEIVLIILYVILSCSGLTFMKAADSSDIGLRISNVFLSWKSIVGLCSYGVSFLIYMFVISKTQISIMIPLLSAVNSIIILVIGIILFKESMNAGQSVGVCLVVIGAFVISLFSRR